MFQSEQHRMIRRRARLRRADPFAFEIFRFLDCRRANENVVHLIDHAGDHDEIGASCARANHRLPGHAHDRHVARDERLSRRACRLR